MTAVTQRYENTSGRNSVVAPKIQNEALQVTAVVLSMIKENKQALKEIETWAENMAAATVGTGYVFTAVTLDMVTDPWFWLSMHLITYPTSFGGWGMYPMGGCCAPIFFDSRDEKACLGFLLVIAIGILVAAFAVSVGLTVKHGMDAEKARKRVDAIKQYQREATDERVKKIYNRVSCIQTVEWASQCLKTAFTATNAAGVGCLTISAIFALYAVCSGIPIYSYATAFAIAGGVTFGGGLGGHLVRWIILQAKKRSDVKILHQLYNDVMQLKAPHPYRILAETGQENATMVVGEYRFIKEGDTFTKEASAPPRGSN